MIPLLFLTIIIQFILTIISYSSIDLKVVNPNCKEDIKNVKQNKLSWRILQTSSLVILIIVFILIQL